MKNKNPIPKQESNSRPSSFQLFPDGCLTVGDFWRARRTLPASRKRINKWCVHLKDSVNQRPYLLMRCAFSPLTNLPTVEVDGFYISWNARILSQRLFEHFNINFFKMSQTIQPFQIIVTKVSKVADQHTVEHVSLFYLLYCSVFTVIQSIYK